MNDDWYSIYASLVNTKSFIISNDQFKDHIFKISESIDFDDIFLKWYEHSQIKYEYPNKIYKKIKLLKPQKYSKRIQNNNDFFHIPYIKNNWLCFKKR